MGEGGDSQNDLIQAEDEEGAKHAMIPPPSGPGGGGDMSGQVDQMEDKMEKLLNKIPPDWDVAENYGKANLAYDPSKCTDAYDMNSCLLYTSPSPRDRTRSRMPSSA